MGLLILILIIVAGLLALLDIVLPYAGRDVRFRLTPVAVILLCAAMLIGGAGGLT